MRLDLGGSTSQNTAGVKRDSSQCALPPYPGVSLCLWSGRAADWRGMLSDPALLQYSMRESILTQLSEQYPDDVILLCCDSAVWHTSGGLNLPDNFVLFYVPPYTPEMNPIG